MKQDPEADLSGFYPAALQAGADKGKQYALPLECVPQMMFINKTLLQKEHIRIPDNDWTWDEFYSLCEQLTRDTDGDGTASLTSSASTITAGKRRWWPTAVLCSVRTASTAC